MAEIKTEELKKEAEEYFKSICEDYNEEYEQTGKRHYFVGFDIKNGYLARADPREKRIADLEKENANLKAYYLKLLEKEGYVKFTSYQLTEAKRLLASWVDDRPHTVSEHKDLISDTELFLSEVEK